MRIPGEGTDKLINRKQEADVYQAISRHGLCDDPVYINPENGYKITKFLNGVRECDPDTEEDISICMKKLRSFHDMNLQVDHVFDLFGHIDFYQSLWHGKESVFHDYDTTKRHVFALKDCIEKTRKQWCLTHIDAVPDNFLFYQKEDGTEGLQHTDWEYGDMQDPHVDIAMFCIYSFYDKAHCDHLIDLYFNGTCTREIRRKIYCYIAVCGLLWSNWCEYKSQQGVEFSEYNLRQYRYAKEFYRYACEMGGSSIMKAENAVIMAAGTSSRFAPLSYERPKALISVKGEVLIERQIRQLKEAGISKIYIITGYKHEQFTYLKKKFDVELIHNPDYLIRNNNSSIFAARNILGQSFVCSADKWFVLASGENGQKVTRENGQYPPGENGH